MSFDRSYECRHLLKFEGVSHFDRWGDEIAVIFKTEIVASAICNYLKNVFICKRKNDNTSIRLSIYVRVCYKNVRGMTSFFIYIIRTFDARFIIHLHMRAGKYYSNFLELLKTDITKFFFTTCLCFWFVFFYHFSLSQNYCIRYSYFKTLFLRFVNR